MSYKVVIDNKYQVKIKDGFSISEQLDETLDSGEVFFNTKENLDIEPYDEVEFFDSNNTSLFAQCINSRRVEDVNPFQDDVIHGTTINVFSLTKYLEKITLPNLTITHSKTSDYRNPIYYYIRLYCDLYAPKYRSARSSTPNYAYQSMINSYLQDIATKFNKECPEFQWNNPTLREVLTDLMMVVNCIPILTKSSSHFYNLSFIDLSDNAGTQINTSKLNRKVKDYNSADYCSELTLEMKNTFAKELTSVVLYTGFRVDGGGQFTDDNMMICVNEPIYEVKTLTAYYYSQSNTMVSKDLLPYLKEQSEYDILPTGNIADLNDKETKWWSIKYKRGGKIIDGFSDKFLTIRTFTRIFDNIKASNNRAVYFKVEYTTQSDRKMHVGKYLPSKHEIRNFDAQTSSYADPQRMSIFEYHKINRIGNEIVEIGGTYSSYSEVPQLGQRIDNLILFKRTMVFREDCIIFNGLLTKNYILQDYFTSVRAKQRSWQYVEGSEALTRYDVDKFYCEFSADDVNITEIDIPELYSNDYNSFMAMLLTNENTFKNGHIGVGIYTNDSNHPEYPSEWSKVYVLDTTTEINGLSVVITYQFEDNYSVGKYMHKIDNSMFTDFYKYVDDDGRCRSLDIYYGKFDVSNGINAWNALDIDARINIVNQKPLTTLENCEETFKLSKVNVFKDNAEIIRRSLQFEFCSDSEDLVIGDYLVKNPSIFYNALRIGCVASLEKPSLINRNKLPTNYTAVQMQDDINVDFAGIIYFFFDRDIHETYNDNYYLYFTYDDNLLFAVSIKKVRFIPLFISYQTLKLTLRITKCRDKTIYD